MKRVIRIFVVIMAITAFFTAPLFAGLNSRLLKAVSQDDFKQVKVLIKKGANVNARGNGRETAMHIAAKNAYFEIIAYLIRHGAYTRVKDTRGLTPMGLFLSEHKASKLQWYAGLGYLKTVKALVKKGAGLYTTDKDGRTALQYAASGGYLDMVKYLIARGADIGATNSIGDTALLTS